MINKLYIFIIILLQKALDMIFTYFLYIHEFKNYKMYLYLYDILYSLSLSVGHHEFETFLIIFKVLILTSIHYNQTISTYVLLIFETLSAFLRITLNTLFPAQSLKVSLQVFLVIEFFTYIFFLPNLYYTIVSAFKHEFIMCNFISSHCLNWLDLCYPHKASI